MTNKDKLFTTGMCNWKGFSLSIEQIEDSAQMWKDELSGVSLPWLCWNVDPEWCLIQQKLVRSAGWTPVVGGDPRAKKVRLLEGSVYVDFNKSFRLPTMHFLFPIEFCWMFTEKIAFWHSDFLIKKDKIMNISRHFKSLKDGDMGVTIPSRGLRMKLLNKDNRYWELMGCATRKASKSQFINGAGWFSNILHHPNAKSNDLELRKKVFWDHGSGVMFWHKNYAPSDCSVYKIKESYIEEGHCSRIRNKKYIPKSPDNEKRNLSKDLIFNYSLRDECERLGISGFLD